MLPAEVRRRLGLQSGDELVLSEEVDGSLRLQSRRSAARFLIGLAGAMDHSAVDDLRAERRREVADDHGRQDRRGTS